MKESQIVKILHVLVRAKKQGRDWLWIREIARLSKLHPEIVRRALDTDLREAIEEVDVEPLLAKGLRIRPVMLKDGITVRGYLRYLRAKGRL